MSTNNLLRVTQMNAIFLDNEINRTFTQLIKECYKYLPPGITAPYDPEINLLIRLAILKYSVMTNSSTFGQQLLSIKYENMNTFKKIVYMLANCSEYIEERFYFSSKFFRVYSVIKLLGFLNISIFLRNGVKPLLVERLLRLNQVYATENVPRHFESKYLARELLWNGFIEVFLHILPLINYHRLRRTIRNHNPFRVKPMFSDSSKLPKMTMHSKCACCGDNPIIPHHMGCEHIFCYVCLKGNQTADPKYECPICEHCNPKSLCEKVVIR